jgi:hypothetical protein
LGFLAAFGTDYRMHFPLLALSTTHAAATVLRLAGRATFGATAGLILKATGCVEFLLTSGENEFLATITTG